MRCWPTIGQLPAPTILAELLQQLGPIWPSRLTLGGIALGDCWRHPALTTADATSGLVPLHKLSQWLAYSLIEPLQTAGIDVTDIDGLTGLAEYRNGGLFVDTGVLAFRDADAAQQEHEVASPLVVEWRALTVALLDRVADGRAAPAWARCHLAAAGENSRGRNLGRGPTAGARTPRRRVASGESHQRRHGFLDPRISNMDGVTIVNHPLVQHKLTLLRKKDISTKSFRELLKEIGMLLCYEVTRDLPLADVEIETPLAQMKSPQIAGKKLVFAPVLRAGVTFAEGMLDLVPTARIAHIGLYREPETFVAVEYFFKAPSDLHERLVIVISPVLATANSAVAAVDRLKERGANDIRLVCLIGAPEGVERMRGIHPDVPIWLAAIDQGLDDNAYIVPGLGDAGDRAYGTK